MTVRTIAFDYGDTFEPEWHPRLPEFAAVANSVSMLMPHLEPYVARSVRSASRDLPEPLRSEATSYAGQELQHHVQHRRFNDHVVAKVPAMARIDRWSAAVVARLESRASVAFHLAFAAAFETMAYSGARWVDQRAHRLLDGSDPVAATLFLWHLAEEVEHKSVAFDVMQAHEVKGRTRVAGALVAFIVLAVFATLAIAPLLWSGRLLRRPMTHIRLATWGIGFTFELLPALVVSLTKGHHPSRLVDPSWMSMWLSSYDPETGQLPLWTELA